MAAPRDWIVAIGDVSGEYAGHPLTIAASEFYGPYTADQAAKLSFAGEGFPDETKQVWVFQIDGKPPVKKLLKEIAQAVADEQAEASGGA